MQSLLWLCALCVSFATGCIHDGIDAALSVDKKIVTVDARANYVSYTVTANTDWTISCSDDWCTPNVEGGTGTTTIFLTIEANDSSLTREATLSLLCGGKTTTVSIKQGALSAEMAVAPGEIEVDYTAQNVQIAVMSNVEWSVSSSESSANAMVKSYTTSGSDNGIITVECGENKTYAERTATITVMNRDKTLVQSVTISQLAAGLPSLSLAQESLSFGNLAETQYVALSSNISDIKVSSDFGWCEATYDESGSRIAVAVEQNSTSLSRSAVVTVSGVVDGESVSAQIVVSQAGVGFPTLYIINDAISVGQAGVSNMSVAYSAENVENVELVSYDPFITINGDNFDVAENTAKESRVGTVVLKATNSGNERFYYVSVSQAGVGTPSIASTPSSIALPAYAGSGSFYAVVSNPAVEFISATSSNDWLVMGSEAGTEDDNLSFTYTYTDNQSDAARTGYISLEYTVGEQNVFHVIPVTQNGLGAPAISTLQKVYMLTDQVTHTQSLWLADGDDTNVTYEVYVSSNDSYATGSATASVEWLTAAIDAANRELTLTAPVNTASESRSGVVTIIASRDNAQSIVKIDVTQAGHLSAGISGLQQEIYVDHLGYATPATFPFNALNDSEVNGVKVSNTAMVTAAAITANSSLDIMVEPYDGSLGMFRECIITLSADNGNSVVEYYDILVRQYEPDAAMADVPALLEMEYDDVAAKSVTIDLYNGAEIVDCKVVESGSWLTASFTGDVITYTPEATNYDGADGEERTATISITVENENANTATYFIPVVQYAPRATTLSAAAEVSVLAPITTATVKYTTTGDGDITVTPTATDAAWITAVPAAVTATEGSAEFVFTLEANPNSVSRSAVVTLTAKGDNIETVSTEVTITQAGTGDAMIELPSDIAVGYETEAANAANGGVITPGVSEGTTITSATTDAAWLDVTFTDATITYSVNAAYDGSEGVERYTSIKVISENSVTGQEATNYITVTQTAPLETTITAPAMQTVTALLSLTDNTSNIPSTINFVATGDNNDASGVADWAAGDFTVTTDVAWIKASTLVVSSIDPATGVGEIALEVNPNTAAESREAQITIKAKGDHAEAATIYVTLTQLGLDAPTATFSTGDYISANYIATAAPQNVTIDLGDGDSVVSVANSNAWLTTTFAAGATSFTYELEEYDGAAGATRTDTIVVTVQNEGGLTMVDYYITVVQNAPKALVVSATPTYRYNANVSGPATFTLGVDVLGDLTASATDATYVATIATDDNGTWASVDHVAAASGDLTLTLEDNAYAEERTAIITITTDNGAYYQPTVSYIEIVQAGTGDALIDVQSTLDLVYTDVSATVTPTLSEGTTIEVSNDSEAGWLTTTTSDNETFDYTATANDGAEPRTAVITIKATNAENGHTGNAYIYVTQAAPEAPSIVAPATVAVDAYGATTADNATKTLFYTADGDGTLSATAQSAGSNITSITTSTVGEVVIEMLPNLTSSSRTETITLELASDASTEKAIAYIDVVQAGVGSPVADFASDVVSYNYAGATAATMAVTLNEGTSVVSTTPSATWITNVTESAGTITYDVAAYDGAEGASRTATIDVAVENASDNMVYGFTIVQTAPIAPSISIQSSATLVQEGTQTTVNYTLAGDSATTLDLATPEVTYADGAGWLTTATAASGVLTLEADANTGTASRTATIKLTTVAQASATPAVEYITVTQLGLDSPSATFAPMAYSYDYTGASSVSVVPNLSKDAHIKSVTSSDVAMVADPAITAPADTFSFEVTENTAAEKRTAYLTIVVDNYDASDVAVGDEVTYVLTITQTGKSAITLSAPAVVTVDADATVANISFTTNDSAATITDGGSNNITGSGPMAITLTPNTSTNSISTQMTFTATADAAGAYTGTATETVTVVQLGTASPSAAFTQMVYDYNSDGTMPSETVTPELSAYAKIKSVTASNSAMVPISAYTAPVDSFNFAVVENMSTEPLTAYVTVVVDNYDGTTWAGEAATYVLTITQDGITPVTLTTGDALTVEATATSATINYMTNGNAVLSSDATFSDGVTIANATGGLDKITISFAANTSSKPRTATISLTASNTAGTSEDTKYVTITQRGTGAPLLAVGTTLTASTSVVTAQPIDNTPAANVPLNVTSNASWLKIDDATQLAYTIAANYDGSEGATRYATITVKATDSVTGAVEVTNIAVAQNAPLRTTITASTNVPAPAAAGVVNASFSTSGSNVAVTPSFDGTIVTGVSADPATGKVAIDLSENKSASPRSTVVELVAKGDHAESAVAYINVEQAGSGTPTATFVEDVVTYKAPAVTTPVVVTPMLSSGAKISAATTTATWLHVDASSIASGEFSYTIDEYTGSEGASRSATIAVTVTDAAGDNPETYNLTIVQVQPTFVTVNVLNNTITTPNAFESTALFSITPTNAAASGVTFSVKSAEAGLTLKSQAVPDVTIGVDPLSIGPGETKKIILLADAPSFETSAPIELFVKAGPYPNDAMTVLSNSETFTCDYALTGNNTFDVSSMYGDSGLYDPSYYTIVGEFYTDSACSVSDGTSTFSNGTITIPKNIDVPTTKYLKLSVKSVYSGAVIQSETLTLTFKPKVINATLGSNAVALTGSDGLATSATESLTLDDAVCVQPAFADLTFAYSYTESGSSWVTPSFDTATNKFKFEIPTNDSSDSRHTTVSITISAPGYVSKTLSYGILHPVLKDVFTATDGTVYVYTVNTMTSTANVSDFCTETGDISSLRYDTTYNFYTDAGCTTTYSGVSVASGVITFDGTATPPASVYMKTTATDRSNGDVIDTVVSKITLKNYTLSASFATTSGTPGTEIIGREAYYNMPLLLDKLNSTCKCN